MRVFDEANADEPSEDVIVVGAGPSGLAAALALARGRRPPLILEREATVGGLMRSPKWRGFTVDLGRKELYTRFPEVDALWSETLAGDYVPYPHRVGSLYRGRILELSGAYRGPLRGLPATWLATGAASMLRGWLAARAGPPRTYEAYWHRHVGSGFSRMLAQGYWEKFRGRRWCDMPPPEEGREAGHAVGMLARVLRLATRGGVAAQAAWRHPRGGTGQLFEALHGEATRLGARTVFRSELRALQPLAGGGFALESIENGKPRRRTARRLVATLPAATLLAMLGDRRFATQDSVESRRSVVLVYLFLSEPPRFPHAWIEVNDPALRVGRITSYGAFSEKMVPAGHTGLCAEFFCMADDVVMQLDDAAATRLAVSELATARLIDPGKLLDSMVLRLPRTNAAASWREQQGELQGEMLRALKRYPDLYHTNRPGSDWATLAGLLAGEAIVTGSRAAFDERADPTLRHSAPLAAPAPEPDGRTTVLAGGPSCG